MEDKQYVFVKIDLNKLEDYDIFWMKTTCTSGFYGKLLNQCWDTFYFELEDKTMVAIPIKWVRWMAPIDKEMEAIDG